MEYRINLDNTITPIKVVESEFRKKLRQVTGTTKKDEVKLKQDTPQQFDEHKYRK